MTATLEDNKNEEYFISPTNGRRDFSEAMEDICAFVREDLKSKYSIVVGTDSKAKESSPTCGAVGAPTVTSGEAADFVSVITVHRIGKHGRYFWKRMPPIKAYDHHDRMLKEAMFSLDLAQRVISALRDHIEEKLYNFEIHLDIGYNGPTKPMISEIVGMVTGNGFVARIKPESYAANKVADRHV